MVDKYVRKHTDMVTNVLGILISSIIYICKCDSKFVYQSYLINI